MADDGDEGAGYGTSDEEYDHDGDRNPDEGDQGEEDKEGVQIMVNVREGAMGDDEGVHLRNLGRGQVNARGAIELEKAIGTEDSRFIGG